jgi:hypothetical protein
MNGPVGTELGPALTASCVASVIPSKPGKKEQNAYADSVRENARNLQGAVLGPSVAAVKNSVEVRARVWWCIESIWALRECKGSVLVGRQLGRVVMVYHSALSTTLVEPTPAFCRQLATAFRRK